MASQLHFGRKRKGTHMAVSPTSFRRKVWQTLSSIKTGVILLTMVVIFSAAGTIVLQRPVTDSDEMQRAYSPQVLSLLDKTGLTDVFHAWWFVALLILVSLSIIAASVDRFPNAWRYFARPYKSPDKAFRRALLDQKSIPISDEETGLVAAERALHSMGFKPERVIGTDRLSIFAERNRLSEMAVYIVHASLLLIFLGGIVDALWGWRGFITLTKGQQASSLELRDGKKKALPFAIRCDGAGQENYQDGSPKKWWSQLAVVRDGHDVQKKEIVVNDPLVYNGVRVYQASYGPTGKLDKLILTAAATASPAEKRNLPLALDETVPLDSDTTVKLAEFIPDYVVRDHQVYTRSTEVTNPAAHLILTSQKTGKQINFWLPPLEGFAENAESSYQFEVQDLKLGYFTGLEVSHEPGQWGVWCGVILMGMGLTFVFYLAHIRFWAVPVRDLNGKLVLWIGGNANRNRDAFQQRFEDLAAKIESELNLEVKAKSAENSRAEVASIA
jgi:cytochrome c biogenesis protein